MFVVPIYAAAIDLLSAGAFVFIGVDQDNLHLSWVLNAAADIPELVYADEATREKAIVMGAQMLVEHFAV